MLHPVEVTNDNHLRAPAVIGDASDRLAARRYEILDTPPEAAFDHITALAADLFGVPIAIIGFLDRSRLWFKSHHGLEKSEMSWAPDLSGPSAELRFRREFNAAFFAGAPLRTSDGHELGTLCVLDRQPRPFDPVRLRHLEALAKIVVDHLELRLAKNQASARNALMASEIDHRAMNSLQFVASLLHLQSRSVDPGAAQQLKAAANRVLAVARVHRSFAAAETASHVPAMAYLRRLCSELSDILGAPVVVEGSEASVPADRILAIGLIVNELVTNAKKHGAGTITITFDSPAEGQCRLCVLDRGDGLPADFSVDLPGGGGLGMRMIAVLVTQLNGKLSAGANPAGRGACFTVVFPAA